MSYESKIFVTVTCDGYECDKQLMFETSGLVFVPDSTYMTVNAEPMPDDVLDAFRSYDWQGGATDSKRPQP